MPEMATYADPRPSSAYDFAGGSETDAGSAQETAWIEVIRKMEEVYSDLIQYEVELEEKNTALEEAQRFINSVLSAVSDILIVCDQRGHIQQVNLAFLQLTGFAEADLLNLALEELLSDDAPELRLYSWIDAGAGGDREVRFRSAEGGLTDPVALNCATRLDHRGLPAGIVLTGRPVGELRRAYEALKQAQAQLVQQEKMASLGRLIAGVAHELNNPISFVYGNVHALSKYSERIGAYLDAIHGGCGEAEREELRRSLRIDETLSDLPPLIDGTAEGAQRVADIVRSLKRLSFSSSGGPEIFDLAEVVSKAVQWSASGSRGGAAVGVELADKLPVRGNAGQLHQVVVNLVQNALDAVAGRAGAHVSITGTVFAGEVVVTVEDNGPGISDAILTKVFDPFFTTKPVGKGYRPRPVDLLRHRPRPRRRAGCRQPPERRRPLHHEAPRRRLSHVSHEHPRLPEEDRDLQPTAEVQPVALVARHLGLQHRAVGQRQFGPHQRPQHRHLTDGGLRQVGRQFQQFHVVGTHEGDAAAIDGATPHMQPAHHGAAAADRAGHRVDVAQEAVDERRRRAVVDLRRRADLLDPPLVHHHHLVGHFQRLFLVMGNEDAGKTHFVVQMPQPTAQVLAHLGVEGAERFVQQQQPGLHRQGAGQGDALALAARQLAGVTAGQAAQLNQIEQGLDPLGDDGLAGTVGTLAHLEAEGDVLGNAHMAEQGIVLKYEADPAITGSQPGGIDAIQTDTAAVGLFQSGQDAQQRRLAGPGRPQQRHQLSLVHPQRDPIKGREGAEMLGDVLNLDHPALPTRTGPWCDGNKPSRVQFHVNLYLYIMNRLLLPNCVP